MRDITKGCFQNICCGGLILKSPVEKTEHNFLYSLGVLWQTGVSIIQSNGEFYTTRSFKIVSAAQMLIGFDLFCLFIIILAAVSDSLCLLSVESDENVLCTYTCIM